MSSPRRSLLIAWILLGMLAAPGSAQVVRGRLLDRSGGAPVAGGVVTLLDTTGAEVGQALSRASGWYALTAPGPGRYRLRAERIGYRDVVTRPFTLAAGQVVERDLVASVRAIPLAGLTVRGKGRCELGPEQGVQTVALWSAVRTALTATRLTRLQGRLDYDVAEYTRALDPRTLDPLGPPTSTIRSGLAEHPFVSAPVAALMSEGFVRRGADTTVYYAPDARVLMSAAFLDMHCLQVVLPDRRDTADAGTVGLAFRPIMRRDVPDVRGTLWVDVSTDELRALTYRYTGLDVPSADKLGGRVDFARLPSGLWIVSRWYVRMPVLTGREAGPLPTDMTPSQLQPHLDRILEQGGVILGARDATGALVYASRDALARELVAAAHRPPPTTPWVGMVCPDSLLDRGEGRLQGVVRHQDTGKPVPDATVVVEWTRLTPVAGASLRRFRGVPMQATAQSDAAGRYAVCGLPLEAKLHAYARSPGYVPVGADVTLPGRRPLQWDLDVAPERAQEISGEGSATGSVTGRVVNGATSTPIPDVQVVLSVGSDSAGPSTGTLSGPDGTFSFMGVAPGAHRLRAVVIGYTSGAWTVHVGPNGLALRLELFTRPVPLKGLTVQAERSLELGGFYTRRAEHIGTFFDRAQIEKDAPKRPSDLMRRVPGLRVICPGFSMRCKLRTEAPPTLAGPDRGDCPMQYYVDGILFPGFQLDDLQPDEIEAIEVYTHAAEVPARFSTGVNARCGVIVIWTRGR